jgi:hypothetical protein
MLSEELRRIAEDLPDEQGVLLQAAAELDSLAEMVAASIGECAKLRELCTDGQYLTDEEVHAIRRAIPAAVEQARPVLENLIRRMNGEH